MLKVGLTGGIGCGKSTAVNALQQRGAAVIDADQIARDVLKAGSTGLQAVVQQFGKSILQANGELDRAKLKSIVFAPGAEGSKALAALEQITHPKIRAQIQTTMQTISAESDAPYLLVDIPLLVEKNYPPLFDRIVVVDCTEAQQIQRVSARDQLPETTIKKIMAQQATRQQRLDAATDVLDNSGDIDHLMTQVEQLHQQFERLSKMQL